MRDVQAFGIDHDQKEILQLDAAQARDIVNLELTQTEFAAALSMHPESTFIQQMFALVDFDNNGYISFREFLDMIVIFAKGTAEDKTKLMFDMYDIDHSGKLSREEFANMIKSLLELANQSLSQERLNELISSMFKEAGLEGKQTITLDDFKMLLSSHKDQLGYTQLNFDVSTFKGAPPPSMNRNSVVYRAQNTLVRAYSYFGGKSDAPTAAAALAAEATGQQTRSRLNVQPLALPRKANYEQESALSRYMVAMGKFVENHRLEIFWLTLYTLVLLAIFCERALLYFGGKSDAPTAAAALAAEATGQQTRSRLNVQPLALPRKANYEQESALSRYMVAMGKFVENHRLEIFWLTLYTLVLLAIFCERAYYYSVEREHGGLRQIAGYGVTITRGAASAQMFTYSTLLFTMCRNSITFLRDTFLHRYVPFDSAIPMHLYIAIWAGIFSVIHSVGHALNFYHISTQTADDLTCLFREYYHATDELPKFHYWCFATMTDYSVEREHGGLRQIAGYGVTITRGAASAQMFTYSTLLFTMCRNSITFLRDTFLHRYVPFDSAIPMHLYIAIWAGIFSVIHSVGHALNFYHISTQTADDLTCLFREYYHASESSFYTQDGRTAKVPLLRRHVFNAFWNTHNLYPAFYILMVLHGLGRLVQPPIFYYFFLGPLVLYVLDRLVSLSRKKVEISVIRAEHLPSDVTMLLMKRPANFEYRSGQWVRIASLGLNGSEYHPFTLSSAPHEDNLSVHVRALGPWTINLRRIYDPSNLPDKGYPKIYLDGPYGGGHQDWFRFEVSVLVGGGIGVTPFASILKDIAQRASSRAGGHVACKKVYFIWVTRTQKHFEWMTDIIRQVEERDAKGFVSVHIFITQFYHKFDLRTTMLYICERHFQRISNRSLFTGLRAITHFGRPDFSGFLDSLQVEHPTVSRFGVFSCGPFPMTRSVQAACDELNRKEGALFDHHYENF
ncbi:hypothetical protein HPB50_001717 [Hyalomma asiaticum]|uniref:Uncharacterized protein n=1 Tax=Hyalomma asiaticum TaxID=266040 RepID=A0ACB7SUV9_HYAAI|nr:hypothetical protein HPB50_001717 [Hyalomma asiaticum]